MRSLENRVTELESLANDDDASLPVVFVEPDETVAQAVDRSGLAGHDGKVLVVSFVGTQECTRHQVKKRTGEIQI